MISKRIKSVLKAIEANEIFLQGSALQARHKERTRINKEARERTAYRYHSDPAFKLMSNLRNRIASALKSKRNRKTAKTEKLLGCSISEFKSKIESLWLPGMTWENHGKWHLDHIKPCNAFDLSNVKEQMACFHWSNYQPLWASANLSKSDRWDGKLVRLSKREVLEK